MKLLKASYRSLSNNILLTAVIVILMLIPAYATWGEYISSGYWKQSISVNVLFWPGIKGGFAVEAAAWIVLALFTVLYLTGLGKMAKTRTLVQVTLFYACAILSAKLLAAAVNELAGWEAGGPKDLGQMQGSMHRLIFALWHNPVWEEIVFRIVPLAIVVLVWGKNRERIPKLAKWAYLIIPSVIFAAYHIPGHGLHRLADTFVIGFALAWVAFRYGVLEVVVLHLISDIMMLPSLVRMKGVPLDEIPWLAVNGSLLGNSWNVALLAVMVLVPLLLVWYGFKHRRNGGVNRVAYEQSNNR